MQPALQDVKRRFSDSPAFDDGLQRQLDAYEELRREQILKDTSGQQNSFHDGTPFRPVRPPTQEGTGVWRTAQRVAIPPEIRRPAAVQKLLQELEPMDLGPTSKEASRTRTPSRTPSHAPSARHTSNSRRTSVPFEPPPQSRTPRSFQEEVSVEVIHDSRPPTPRSARLRRPPRRQRQGPELALAVVTGKRLETSDAATDVEVQEHESPTAHERASRRLAAAAKRKDHRVSSPASRRSSIQSSASGVPPFQTASSNPSMATYFTTPNAATLPLDPLDEEEWAWRKLEGADENIDRAFARRSIQNARLRRQGKVAPGASVEGGGTQTDAGLLSMAIDMPSGVRTPTSNEGSGQRAQTAEQLLQSTAKAVAAQAPFQPTLLQPMGTRETDSFLGSPSPVEPLNDGSKASDREWSLAWARSPKQEPPEDPSSRLQSLRNRISSEIDKTQLRSEESVIALGLSNGDKELLRKARDHVAASQRPLRGSGLAPPLGGFRSFADGTRVGAPAQGEPGAIQQTSFDESRWVVAKEAVEADMQHRQGAEGARSGYDPSSLRQWAAEHAAATEKRARRSELPVGKGQSRSYSARRKWGEVTFANPVENDPTARVDLARSSVLQPSPISYGFADAWSDDPLQRTHEAALSMFPGTA